MIAGQDQQGSPPSADLRALDNYSEHQNNASADTQGAGGGSSGAGTADSWVPEPRRVSIA